MQILHFDLSQKSEKPHKYAQPLPADWFLHSLRGLALHPSSPSGLCTAHGSQRFGGRSKKRRRCGYENDTLPRVLCHCKLKFTSITSRHNAIQDRLVKTFNTPASTEVRVNQGIPELDGALRPDLVTVDEANKTVTAVDVTLPFENRYTAFQAARHEKKKKKKYAPPAGAL